MITLPHCHDKPLMCHNCRKTARHYQQDSVMWRKRAEARAAAALRELQQWTESARRGW